MKKTDFWGAVYIAVAIALLFVFRDRVVQLTKAYAYLMGFVKVSFLATFGECLKTRIITGVWIPSHLFQRFLVWGLFGMWFAAAFPFFSAGADALIAKNLWFSTAGIFSKSLWINAFGGYAYFMMGVHEIFNRLIENQGMISADEFKEKLDAKVWFSLKWYGVPATIAWFWLPWHTFTFSLLPHDQVLCAAFLSIALGSISAGLKFLLAQKK